MTPTALPVLEACGLRKWYAVSRPQREVVRGVSVRIEAAEVVAIMGPSGCGKSTLLAMLGGLEEPDAGTVAVEGRDLYGISEDERSTFRRDRLGFVYQRFNLLPGITAAENVALPLRLRAWMEGRRSRLSQRVIQARVGALMDQLSLHGLQGHSPDQISGGERQRIAIGRALAAAPALVLADEPTGNLDWVTAHEVMGTLLRLCREEQQSTLLVTHDAAIAAYADRVLVMTEGRIVEEIDDHIDRTSAAIPDAKPLVRRLAAIGL